MRINVDSAHGKISISFDDPGPVAKTLKRAASEGEPTVEIDVNDQGFVVEARLTGFEELFEELVPAPVPDR